MGLGTVDLRAKSRKGRGLFRKGPDPREIGDRLGRLTRRMLRDAVVRSGAKGDRYIVELRLVATTTDKLGAVTSQLLGSVTGGSTGSTIAGATTARLVVMPDAELHVHVDASALGPGYVAHLVEKLAPILDELEFGWAEPFDLAATQASLCAALADELRADDAGSDARAVLAHVKIGLPAERRFRVDAPVLTALGPRDAQWRDAVLADPMHARDAFAWWDAGPGREERARALLAMSFEVPWREPLDKNERELMEHVDEDLRAARKADPSLALPYAEWKELLMHLGIEDEDVNEKVAAASASPASASTLAAGTSSGLLLGYRRFDLEVELQGGWHIVMPGSLVGRWDDDGAKYWATDGDRAIEFSSLTAPEEPDSAKLLAVAPEHHEVIERLVDGDRHGRAEAFDDSGTPILVGLMCQAPHVGILTCKGGTREWALATWRSVRR